jgi:HdeA/HdeB family
MVTSRIRIDDALRAALGRLDWRAGLFTAAMLAGSATASQAQTELKNYVGANGYIQVQKLTCAQLADTYQEDAELLGVWYSGWLNGRAKGHLINVDRTKDGIHQVIVYCKANPDKKVVDAVKMLVNQAKSDQ